MRRAARYLAISSKKSMCALKKNDRRGANASTSRPSALPELDVCEAVRDRERELLRGRRARFADVVAGDRDRVPFRQLGRAERNRVAHQTHRRPGREDEFLLRLIFLQDVVLQGAAEAPPCDTIGFGVRNEHRKDHRRRAVDRHRCRDRAEVDPAVQILDVCERVDGHAAFPDLTQRERVVGVAAHQCRQVERGRESVAPGREQFMEASVRVDRGAEAREHPHRPEL